MKITSIRMEKIENPLTILANFSIVLDNQFAIHNISLIKGKDRNFIAFYSRRNNEGKYLNVCHPIVPEFRQYIENELLSYYENNIEE